MRLNDQSMEISRVTRSKGEARKAYDRMSRWYDLMASSSERPFAQMGLRLLAITAGESVLEIGYGTGHILQAMTQLVGEEGWVFGLDISTGMSRVARQRLASAGVYSSVQLVCGDAGWLPFASGKLDAVFLSFTLELFDTPEIPLALEACRRILKPGGRLCVVSLSKEGGNTLPVRLYAWAHRKFPAYVDCRPIYVQSSLERIGFRVVKAMRKSMWGLPVEICLAKTDF